MSDSVMPPTAACTMLTFTSSVESFVSACCQRFVAALHVGLDDQRQRLDAGFAHLLEHVLELRRLLLRELHVAELALAEQRDLARLALVAERHHVLAGERHVGQALDLDRNRGTRLVRPACRLSSVIARTRPNTAPASTTSPRFSVPECTSTVATGPRPLSRRDSMTMPFAGASRRRLELEHFGLQQDRVEQLVDALRRSSPTPGRTARRRRTLRAARFRRRAPA